MSQSLRTAVIILGTSLMIWGCASVKVGFENGMWGLTITGKDGFIIAAEGLEDAKDQANDHLTDLMAQSPPNQDWIDDWKETYDGIIDAKKDMAQGGGAEGEGGKGSKAGKPV